MIFMILYYALYERDIWNYDNIDIQMIGGNKK